MKILVTGAIGQLGNDVMAEAARHGHTIIGTSRRELPVANLVKLELSDAVAVEKVFNDEKPDVVIHCAGWTAVDKAEEAEHRADVYAANVTSTENIANSCKKHGTKMIYISTDYVFGDEKDSVIMARPHKEDDIPGKALNYYGETKRIGEQIVEKTLDKYFIVRISWLFGINGNNFVKTMIHLASTVKEVRVVADQIGTPTYSRDLAQLLIEMSESDKYGVYHATNEGGYISWADFCEEIYRLLGIRTKIIPISSAEYGSAKAKRPHNSRLSKEKLVEAGFKPLPDWKVSLRRFINMYKDPMMKNL